MYVLCLARHNFVQISEDDADMLESAIHTLYGMIHARFLLTTRGIQALYEKYNQGVYGLCWNEKCEEEQRYTLPTGMDVIGQESVQVYCPNCGECYKPRSSKLAQIDGAYFGNGVVVSKDQKYLLMVETTKYRVLKYWLSGEKAGQTEIFIDNLAGFPNGISIREDGSYWLGFSTKRNEALDNIHPKTRMKKFVFGLPEFMQPKAEPFGMIMNLSKEGEILKTLFDTQGAILSEAGAVKEFNGCLYIGGDVLPFIGKYTLDPID